MKRTLSLILAALLLASSMVACGKGNTEETKKQNALKVKAVDSTAAGDSLIASFGAEVDERGIEKAVEYASAVSAIVVGRKGASVSIPSREEVEKFMKEF